MTTTTKTSARVMETDPETGKRYVKIQTVDGATVTVTSYTGQLDGGKWSWSSATYSVTDASGRTLPTAIEWNGKALIVNGRRASSFKAAVSMVTGLDAAPPARRARSRKGSSASASKATGSSVIEADPDTGLPRIKPEVAAKADAIVAAQVAKNAEAGE